MFGRTNSDPAQKKSARSVDPEIRRIFCLLKQKNNMLYAFFKVLEKLWRKEWN